MGDTEEIHAAGNFKSSVPKTFKGDRGGSAEDADLLAELRAISSKSTTNRFDSNGENEENVSNDEMEGGNNIKKESSLPPWKRPKKPMKKKNPELNKIEAETLREAKKEISSPEASLDTEKINA